MVDLAPISQRIWDMKYRLKQADGTPVDNSVEDTWNRVANALAAAEPAESRTPGPTPSTGRCRTSG